MGGGGKPRGNEVSNQIGVSLKVSVKAWAFTPGLKALKSFDQKFEHLIKENHSTPVPSLGEDCHEAWAGSPSRRSPHPKDDSEGVRENTAQCAEKLAQMPWLT